MKDWDVVDIAFSVVIACWGISIPLIIVGVMWHQVTC